MRCNKFLFVIALSIIILPLSVSFTAAEEEKDENPMVQVETNLGSFKIELYQKEAPITVDNFLNYTDKKYYDGTIFHRVIATFMIQGGGFTPEMVKKATGPPIKNEADNGLKNLKYTIAMARTGEVNSATSQFFVNTNDNPDLDHDVRGFGYAVFGKVVEGTEVIDKIKDVKTTTRKDRKYVPVKPVIIKSIQRVKKEAEKKPEKE